MGIDKSRTILIDHGDINPHYTHSQYAFVVNTEQDLYSLVVGNEDVFKTAYVVEDDATYTLVQIVPMRWDSTRGKPGDRGDVGGAGPTGLTGDVGIQGIQGIQGEQGVQGPQGEKGEQGDEGPVGPQGEQGVVGEAGETGADGAVGSVGMVGQQGPTGDQGPIGPIGIPGTEKGPVGDQGIVGPTGDQGPIGPPSASPQGPTGDQGPIGAEGPEGEQGPQGLEAPAGTESQVVGPVGLLGMVGEQGPRGPHAEWMTEIDINFWEAVQNDPGIIGQMDAAYDPTMILSANELNTRSTSEYFSQQSLTAENINAIITSSSAPVDNRVPVGIANYVNIDVSKDVNTSVGELGAQIANVISSGGLNVAAVRGGNININTLNVGGTTGGILDNYVTVQASDNPTVNTVAVGGTTASYNATALFLTASDNPVIDIVTGSETPASNGTPGSRDLRVNMHAKALNNYRYHLRPSDPTKDLSFGGDGMYGYQYLSFMGGYTANTTGAAGSVTRFAVDIDACASPVGNDYDMVVDVTGDKTVVGLMSLSASNHSYIIPDGDAGPTINQIQASRNLVVKTSTFEAAGKDVSGSHCTHWGYSDFGSPDVANEQVRIDAYSGTVYSSGISAVGADVAEYFPTVDDEDVPVGTIMTLFGREVVPATSENDIIVGTITATASIIGNEIHSNTTTKMDEFGRPVAPMEDDENPNVVLDSTGRSLVSLLGQVFVRVYEDIAPDAYVNPIGFTASQETPLRCMEMTTPFDPEKGYGVAYCLLRRVAL